MFAQPLTMADFLEASRGTWLNRRSIHHLDHQDDEAADSNLVIEPWKLIQLAQPVEVDSGGKATSKKASVMTTMQP